LRDAIAIVEALAHPNVQAFLRVIRAGESSQEDDAYRWLFGSTRRAPKLFDSFADHPRVRTYEAYDGQFIKNGKLDYTTAAGAPQITETTWNAVSKRLGLQDFSPRSQDIAACGLIDARGALDDVLAGRIERAMFLCRKEWASLPASDYGQPTQSLANALAVYRRYGGLLHGQAPTPQPAAEKPPAARETVSPPPSDRTPPKEPAMVAPLIAAAAAAAAPDLMRGLAASLIKLFSPLAKEKLTKEMARHTDSPEIANQIATGMVETAMALTGKDDPVDATAAAKADPEIVHQVEADALATLERLAPMLDKIAQWDREAWAAEESSRDAASERARGDPNDQDVFLTRSIVALLVGLMIAIGALIGALVWLKADSGTIGTLVGLFAATGGVIVGEFKTRYQHRYGSSRSSGAKDVVMAELARRGRP
jgi:muramidase (phage lysozyme)